MSDTSPEQKPTATPAEPKPKNDAPSETPKPKGDDMTTAAFRTLQAEHAALTAQLKQRDDKLAEQDRELVKLRGQVDTFGKREREGAIVGELRKALPHASELELRGVLGALAEAGKVDRYSDRPEETAKAALEEIKTSAPALSRPPAPGGGPGGAPPQQQGRKHKSLI